jgi:hypothetical protein
VYLAADPTRFPVLIIRANLGESPHAKRIERFREGQFQIAKMCTNPCGYAFLVLLAWLVDSKLVSAMAYVD